MKTTTFRALGCLIISLTISHASYGQTISSALANPTAPVRSLDEFRKGLKEKPPTPGMPRMAGGGMSMGGGGGEMSGGSDMYGSAPAPSEKQLLAGMIQTLRGRLGSKQYERAAVEKQLRAALKQYFELDMQERVTEFDIVKARMMEMEAKLERRLQNEQEIIELQLKQMLHRADGLDLELPPSQGNDGYGGYGYGGGEGGMSMGSEGGYGSAMAATAAMAGGGEGVLSSGGFPGAMTPAGDAPVSLDASAFGYDVAHGFTRIQRLDASELATNDPLSSYADARSTIVDDTNVLNTDSSKLYRILLAFHEFHDRFHHFPRSANRQTATQPPHSWRVAILPLIGQNELYKQYRFDLPWDSPENMRLIEKMPELYKTGTQSRGLTRFKMPVGNGAFDSGPSAPQMHDITDGTSNTIALIEAQDTVLWTAPNDADYNDSVTSSLLSGARLVGFADGKTRNLPLMDDAQVRALLTRGGNETIVIPD